MGSTQHQPTYRKDIDDLLDNFFYFSQKTNHKLVYALLSPNLQQLSLMKQNFEKYGRAFTFGRTVATITLFKLTELNEGALEAIIIIGLLAADASLESEAGDYKEEDVRFRPLKMRFMDIGLGWCIDDISLYEEFWDNEYKEYYQSQMN